MACTEKNPLIREGISQLSRVLRALQIDYVKPDERQTADIILFAKKYAEYLNYYKSSDKPAGDWEPLMKMDISVTLATLIQIDIKRCSDYKKLLYKKISNAEDFANGGDISDHSKKQFKYLFDLVFSIIRTVDEQIKLLPLSEEYALVIKDIVIKKMRASLKNLNKLYADFKSKSLLDTTTETDIEAVIDIRTSTGFDIATLSDLWSDSSPAVSFSIPSLSTVKEEIDYIIRHNIFNAQIENLLQGVSMIVARAGKLFEQTLENFPSHSPHYALFITFIKLFRFAQDDLNRYTKRHLDFYYKDVLQLKNKNPEADRAHLVFELQKPEPKHLLKKGVLFKGGKDSTGKEISYSLNDDVVLNKASVTEIKALQMLKDAKEILYAFPKAASEDGLGAKLRPADKSWFTFGNPDNPTAAETGFAIASNILFLNEGTRAITITVNFKDEFAELAEDNPTHHSNYFKAKLSGKKDWHQPAVVTVQGNELGSKLVFSFTLNPEDPPIVPYSEKIHKENFETDLPLLKIFLNQSEPNAYPYRVLSRVAIDSVTVNAEVTGVRNLMLSNDTGAIDASKPFKPYGDFPPEGASFYIGSKEIFQKRLTQLSFDFDNENIEHTDELFYLDEGKWKTNSAILFNNNTLDLSGDKLPATAVDFTTNEPLAAGTTEGFIRLKLESDQYSNQAYLDKIRAQINTTKVERTTAATPTYQLTIGTLEPPPELVVNGISINYIATTTICLAQSGTDANSHFYHLPPFGYYETYFDSSEPSKLVSLLPSMPNDGELFVGIANAEPEAVLNILFHVADGTSNPQKDMEPVSWYYLRFNEWIAFESFNVIDRTKNFTQAGIATLNLPVDFTNQNTYLQKGMHWIKASVEKNPDAVCKMIAVQAQAASVQMVQDERQQIEFRQVLPANTISKLVINDAAIKTITQPFDSFGGKTRESDDHFYVRVSERLRHKQRAITIWDYEHFILEEFPQLHKVRCINQAGFYTNTLADGSQEDVFCENYPGHVTIIPIPDFRNKTSIDPLRPYTPARLIKNVDDYLHSIISPFVKLHVKNPQFEEVRLEFNVRFHENLDDAFYREQLDEEIKIFLTPWAYAGNNEISFGGKIIKSVLLNFVEERPYVDHVTCFQMHHVIKRDGGTHTDELSNVEEAKASTARSVLVSYYNETTKEGHLIRSLTNCTC